MILPTRWLLTLVFCPLVPQLASGQESIRQPAVQDPGVEYSGAHLQEYFKRTAASYDIRTAQKAKLESVPGSLLNWSNPVRKQEQGGLFLWTLDQRPAVLVSIYTFVSNKLQHKHEAISFVSQPLTADLDGRSVWEPSATTMEWKQIDSPSPPQIGSSRLLLQMRQIARKLQAKKIELEGDTVDLKLLPQPLYQYKSKKGDFGGALFAFVEATDPEIMFLIEGYTEDDGQTAWRVGAMPSHWIGLEIQSRKKPFWASDANLQMRGRREGQEPWSKQPYFNFFTNDEIPPPEELDAK